MIDHAKPRAQVTDDMFGFCDEDDDDDDGEGQNQLADYQAEPEQAGDCIDNIPAEDLEALLGEDDERDPYMARLEHVEAKH